jgi:hypothetical protein
MAQIYIPGLPEIFIGIILFSLASVVIWIMALVDALQNKRLEGNDKIMWVLLIVFLQFLGAILYYCLAPREKRGSTQLGPPRNDGRLS